MALYTKYIRFKVNWNETLKHNELCVSVCQNMDRDSIRFALMLSWISNGNQTHALSRHSLCVFYLDCLKKPNVGKSNISNRFKIICITSTSHILSDMAIRNNCSFHPSTSSSKKNEIG